ncbi:OPT family oligopeptide transporter [Komagataeibacter medellinensis]|uniref:ABC transporter oligopeptide transporter membrane spanning protein n=1 Tax=Komagataeibacter medellinensis (strain NBRC 3288 / BCRC 11682 / LMG 1693 / Kondo 51) TaxID=634177 RepID=G2I5F1_KOMMN|nr:oligopeptide transporter, OPT family [Komagataeibacter medellinensis]BAK83348.1 ABC transporter oligopeptide transporter membrane spanning protein [Komagataeibacter medellinensis NBRC 3288]
MAGPILQRELTWRGMVIGALITVIFTASNVYLGLRIGLTIATSIPAAVISMAVLRVLGRGTILENNLVQTQASAAGTLACVFASLPALLMGGYWQHFPFLQAGVLTAAGGMSGVLFTIPLRRVMLRDATLPFPEGVAAAEILRAGATREDTGSIRALLHGGMLAAGITFASTGLRLLGSGLSATAVLGAAAFRLSIGFSPALLGAGYLVGLQGGLAMLLGALLTWEVLIPAMAHLTPRPAGLDAGAFAQVLWQEKARFLGVGLIGVAAIWTVLRMGRPLLDSVRLLVVRAPVNAIPERTDTDLSPRAIRTIAGLVLVMIGGVFFVFAHAVVAPLPALAAAMTGLACCAGLGLFVAAACGYMAGLVGSSSSPISGVTILAALCLACVFVVLRAAGLFAGAEGQHFTIGFCLYALTAITASAAIANDNLQDLKTGQMIGATPWKQEIALLIGCASGAVVIPPVLNVLYQTYGFVGAMPHAGMDPTQALAAPQPALLLMITSGIFLHQLDWNLLAAGAAAGCGLIGIDAWLRRTDRGGLPPLAVGIGVYLPMQVSMTLATGALLGTLVRRLNPQAGSHRGTMIASGLIVGESLTGVALACLSALSGQDSPLSLLPRGVPALVPDMAGLVVFVMACTWFSRTQVHPPTR